MPTLLELVGLPVPEHSPAADVAVRGALTEQGDRVLEASRAYRALAPDAAGQVHIDPAMRE